MNTTCRSSLVFAYSVVAGLHSPTLPYGVLYYLMQIGFLTLSWLFSSSIDGWWQLTAYTPLFVNQMLYPCETDIYKQLAESPCCDKKQHPCVQRLCWKYFRQSCIDLSTTYMCCWTKSILQGLDLGNNCQHRGYGFSQEINQNWRNPLGWWHILIAVIVSKHPFTTINKGIQC